MYMNFWYAVEESDKVVTGKPTEFRALRQSFVLFRDEAGKVHCLHNVCAHRGGALGHGILRHSDKGTSIECPYHGWQFNEQGTCNKIPALGPDNQENLPSRAKVDSYPTEEHYGIVFAFLGDLPEDERPPLLLPHNNPRGIDYSDTSKWRSVHAQFALSANYERAVENGIDPAHNEFTHPRHGFSGNKDSYFVPDFDLIQDKWGAGWNIDFYGPPSTHATLHKTETPREKEGFMDVTSGFLGCNQIYTYIHISPTNFMHQYLYECPIDEHHTRVFFIGMLNFLPRDVATDEEIIEMNAIIAGDDIRVLEPLEPIETPDNMTQEVMTPPDKPIVRYREMLKEWDQLGWRLDAKAIKEASGKKVYAIPSPDRRKKKGWVFEAAPLISSE
jgi:phenylpropionate dioxygenase-like ring-hydroxylating dioxygenase large terminal subunit